eukprot:TRINITY_DN7717_c0_g1_i1.p1 TRINITY_DN7717_c0_g1~~TRINITY_DN7717_c0_g1_i1.p1  ORF type:complete len:695 (+),score=156.20 TRINITY_DN7717_c0_g1_i1:598-2682(+)
MLTTTDSSLMRGMQQLACMHLQAQPLRLVRNQTTLLFFQHAGRSVHCPRACWRYPTTPASTSGSKPLPLPPPAPGLMLTEATLSILDADITVAAAYAITPARAVHPGTRQLIKELKKDTVPLLLFRDAGAGTLYSVRCDLNGDLRLRRLQTRPRLPSTITTLSQLSLPETARREAIVRLVRGAQLEASAITSQGRGRGWAPTSDNLDEARRVLTHHTRHLPLIANKTGVFTDYGNSKLGNALTAVVQAVYEVKMADAQLRAAKDGVKRVYNAKQSKSKSLFADHTPEQRTQAYASLWTELRTLTAAFSDASPQHAQLNDLVKALHAGNISFDPDDDDEASNADIPKLKRSKPSAPSRRQNSVKPNQPSGLSAARQAARLKKMQAGTSGHDGSRSSSKSSQPADKEVSRSALDSAVRASSDKRPASDNFSQAGRVTDKRPQQSVAQRQPHDGTLTKADKKADKSGQSRTKPQPYKPLSQSDDDHVSHEPVAKRPKQQDLSQQRPKSKSLSMVAERDLTGDSNDKDADNTGTDKSVRQRAASSVPSAMQPASSAPATQAQGFGFPTNMGGTMYSGMQGASGAFAVPMNQLSASQAASMMGQLSANPPSGTPVVSPFAGVFGGNINQQQQQAMQMQMMAMFMQQQHQQQAMAMQQQAMMMGMTPEQQQAMLQYAAMAAVPFSQSSTTAASSQRSEAK